MTQTQQGLHNKGNSGPVSSVACDSDYYCDYQDAAMVGAAMAVAYCN